jgi:secreted trypsin-like serine protease
MHSRLFRKSLFALALLSACGGATGQADTSEDAIVQGTRTQDLPAVVALSIPGGGSCTATVIAPRVAITAAHCLPKDAPAQSFVLLVGGDPVDPQSAVGGYAVTEVHADPLFDLSDLANGHDIGVVIAEADLVVAPMPVQLSPLPAELSGTKARIFGFGVNNGVSETGAGFKRAATMRITFDDRFVYTGSLLGGNLCRGDSGGPVVAKIDGVETVIAVHSYSDRYCLGFTGASTRVDTYADFVRRFL